MFPSQFGGRVITVTSTVVVITVKELYTYVIMVNVNTRMSDILHPTELVIIYSIVMMSTAYIYKMN